MKLPPYCRQQSACAAPPPPPLLSCSHIPTHPLTVRPLGVSVSNDAWMRFRFCFCRRNCLYRLCPDHIPFQCNHKDSHSLLMPRGFPETYFYLAQVSSFFSLTDFKTLPQIPPAFPAFYCMLRLAWHFCNTFSVTSILVLLKRGKPSWMHCQGTTAEERGRQR